LKGAYTLNNCDGKPDVILTATGSEVELIVKAKAALTGLNVRIVSFPCWELFEEQSQEYKEEVFTPGVPVLSVEAGSVNGWARYAHGSIGMTTFGASAPAPAVYAKFGITVDNIAAKAKALVEFYKKEGYVPTLVRRPF
jgi:transketolase